MKKFGSRFSLGDRDRRRLLLLEIEERARPSSEMNRGTQRERERFRFARSFRHFLLGVLSRQNREIDEWTNKGIDEWLRQEDQEGNQPNRTDQPIILPFRSPPRYTAKTPLLSLLLVAAGNILDPGASATTLPPDLPNQSELRDKVKNEEERAS